MLRDFTNFMIFFFLKVLLCRFQVWPNHADIWVFRTSIIPLLLDRFYSPPQPQVCHIFLKLFGIYLPQCHRERRSTLFLQNVLPTVATSCAAHPQAAEPGAVVQPLHVHGLLPAEFPVGEKALHHLCLGLSGCPFPHLLQLLGQLLPLPLPGCCTPRCSSWPRDSWDLETTKINHHEEGRGFAMPVRTLPGTNLAMLWMDNTDWVEKSVESAMKDYFRERLRRRRFAKV